MSTDLLRLARVYGSTAAEAFGPRALRAPRTHMMDNRRWCRKSLAFARRFWRSRAGERHVEEQAKHLDRVRALLKDAFVAAGIAGEDLAFAVKECERVLGEHRVHELGERLGTCATEPEPDWARRTSARHALADSLAGEKRTSRSGGFFGRIRRA